MEKLLINKNIVLTRAKDQAVQSINDLEQLGANVINFPTIKISTIVNNNTLNETIKNINSFNTLIFTSENAVKSFIEKINELNIKFDPKAFFVISIGDKTSEQCLKNNFRVDFQPIKSSSYELKRELEYIDLIGRNIFIPCSNLAKSDQFIFLENFGAKITSIPVYSNTLNDSQNLLSKIELLNNIIIDLFIFTSPSTFKGFLEIMVIQEPQQYFKNKSIAVIGPVTKEALNSVGLEPNIVPKNFTMNNLIEEIKTFYKTETINN